MCGAITAAVIMVGGSLVAANQAKQAAKGQAAAAQRAGDAAKAQALLEQARLDPYSDAGKDAIKQLRELLAPGGGLTLPFNYEADPGAAFRMQQGLQGVERSAAARGGLLGGGTLKALSRYGSNLASQEYANAFDRWRSQQQDKFNRLSGIAGMGANASGIQGQLGMAGAGAWGQGQIGAANATAAGAVYAGNQYQSAANSIANMLGGFGGYMNKGTTPPPATNTGTAGATPSGWQMTDPNAPKFTTPYTYKPPKR